MSRTRVNSIGIADGQVQTADIATGAVTSSLLDPNTASNGVGKRTVKTDPPSGGNDGDIWYVGQAAVNLTGSIPIGGIIMWSGTIAAAQALTGWALCDGTNSTPDLRNRFIVGAGVASGNYAWNADTGAVTGNYAPGNTGGEAAHKLTIAELASHTHPFTVNAYNTDSNGSGALTGGTNNYYPNVDGSYSGTTSPTGGDKYHENRPPYYALAFIMRTS
jgi:microcystin-dependent protein